MKERQVIQTLIFEVDDRDAIFEWVKVTQTAPHPGVA